MIKRSIPFLIFIMCLFVGDCGDDHSQPKNQQPKRVVNALTFPSSVVDIQLETDQLLIELDQKLAEILAVQISTHHGQSGSMLESAAIFS